MSHLAPLGAPHGLAPPSHWVTRWSHLLPKGCRVLDVACGSGRHVRHLAALGFHLTALDIDAQALATLEDLSSSALTPPVERICADIENQPWPLAGRQFGAVLITNYLWRPLLPDLLQAVEPGGWLIYETFTVGQETIGRPRRPEFLLQPGELLNLTSGWQVVAYEEGLEPYPPRFVQRIVARKPTEPSGKRLAPPHLSPEIPGRGQG